MGGREGVERGGHQLAHVERQRALDQHADQAERMAAQRERVLVAGGHLADAEQARERLELVGHRHRDAAEIARQRVAGEARLVVVLDGVGDLVAQAVVPRVVRAHDSLQLGKLAHHVGEQVGLGEQRRLVRLQHEVVAAERLRHHLRDACPACCDRRPSPARAPATPACVGGPGRRRTSHRPAAGAPRARCPGSRGSGRRGGCCSR